MTYGIAVIPVKAKANPAQACILCVLADYFDYSFEAAEER